MRARDRVRKVLIPVAAVLAAGATAAMTAPAVGAAPAPAVATRPDPGPTVSSSLQSAWQSVLAGRGIRHALIGAYAYDVTTGRTLASIHAGWRLTPGSLTKLYASAASLADWGNRFSLVTRVAQARPGGPVYLVGAGGMFSASLTKPGGNAELERVAKAVAARLRHGASQVVGVSTLFSGWTSGPAWDVSEVGPAGDPSVSALTSNHDEVVVRVGPGAHAGSKAVVSLDPGDPSLVPPGFFRVENRAVTGPPGARRTVYVRCLPGTNTIVISGVKPLGSQPGLNGLALGNPSLYTAALFQHYLARDGVRLRQPAATGSLPGGTHQVYAYRWPESLARYLLSQNGWSVNQMAEDLYRLLGVATGGTGSPRDAQAALAAYLARAHLPADRVQVDGSGLSALDEMSAAQLGGLLTYVAHQRYFSTFEHSLIQIGQTGHCTFLCGIMKHTAAAGHVWLKTGNLANQWNYAGYAHAKNGDLIAFALLFDGLQADNAFDQALGPIDKMTVDAASWPDEPRARPAAPAPAARGGDLPSSVTALLPASVASAVRSGYTPGDVVSASVVNVANGQVIKQSSGQTELQGGLLARLATVATALRHAARLPLRGPEILATGKVAGGRVAGNLVIDGRYDPMFDRQQLAQLAQSLARRGIRSVAGRLEYVAGGSQPFGSHSYGITNLPFSTPYEDVGASFSPPAGPLAVDQDQVTIAVRGAAVPGRPAQVSVEPAGSPVRVTGTIATVAAGSPSAGPAAGWQPGPRAYRVSGSVRAGESASLLVAPPYPALTAADGLLAALHSAGITVHGPPVALADDPGGHRLARLPAPSLAAEVKLAMTDPSNVPPFDLYQLLGPKAGADVSALIGRADQILDPSGNAADDFLTADSISAMLAAIHPDAAQAPLVSLLNQPWIVRLPERITLTGYTTGPHGQVLAYTVIINGQLYQPVPDLPARYEPMISH
ncbi:MAG TPA: D-alanyl-D-alanine carboxypeptidase [Streptosporangiaceae bacterium]|jgi:D-alanyl-D-alanine carboxypeptidase/D-alanyl-D-alanine-endopeptidase (penicillin-binding protein 4)|nr:D-alanyl-D-alanine carboxypeptidase [Streptosporangiaceae bacterium]